MKIKVENDKLIITNQFKDIVLNVDIKELAKALKPFIDSIPNCECKGEIK
jgi:hypothetical protein